MGDILSTVEGYFEQRGNILSIVGDILSTVGDIFEYRGRLS